VWDDALETFKEDECGKSVTRERLEVQKQGQEGLPNIWMDWNTTETTLELPKTFGNYPNHQFHSPGHNEYEETLSRLVKSKWPPSSPQPQEERLDGVSA
jgi:hypothetical protein